MTRFSQVVIFRPARTASQQARERTKDWKMEFIPGETWDSPLMGWAASADPYFSQGALNINFDSAEVRAESRGD